MFAVRSGSAALFVIRRNTDDFEAPAPAADWTKTMDYRRNSTRVYIVESDTCAASVSGCSISTRLGTLLKEVMKTMMSSMTGCYAL